MDYSSKQNAWSKQVHSLLTLPPEGSLQTSAHKVNLCANTAQKWSVLNAIPATRIPTGLHPIPPITLLRLCILVRQAEGSQNPGACCGSFSSTSSSTEVATAVTIANQAEVFVGILPRRQLAAPAPLFKGIIGRFLPCHEQAAFAVDFESLSGGQAKLLAQLARQRQLAVFRYNRSHGFNVS